MELETYYDEEAFSVSIETTHFSRYMIVDRYDWFEAWAKEINYNPGLEISGPPVFQYNTVLVIDCSASMEWVDKIRYKNVNNGVDAQYPLTCGRIESAMNFIKTMSAIDQATVPDSIIEELSGKKVQVYVVCFGGEQALMKAIQKQFQKIRW